MTYRISSGQTHPAAATCYLPKPKRIRHDFKPYQIDFLNIEYQTSPYPNKERRIWLSQQISVPVISVMVCFYWIYVTV